MIGSGSERLLWPREKRYGPAGALVLVFDRYYRVRYCVQVGLHGLILDLLSFWGGGVSRLLKVSRVLEASAHAKSKHSEHMNVNHETKDE